MGDLSLGHQHVGMNFSNSINKGDMGNYQGDGFGVFEEEICRDMRV
jgi:hypothetical protein